MHVHSPVSASAVTPGNGICLVFALAAEEKFLSLTFYNLNKYLIPFQSPSKAKTLECSYIAVFFPLKMLKCNKHDFGPT